VNRRGFMGALAVLPFVRKLREVRYGTLKERGKPDVPGVPIVITQTFDDVDADRMFKAFKLTREQYQAQLDSFR
jgi:hypothetical protein